MKTINSKLQKAGIETLTAMAVLFSACFTISAQGAGFEGRYANSAELALFETIKNINAPSAKSKIAADMAYFAEFLTEESEEELAIEDWMTESTYFGVANLENEYEDVLKVEDWMIKDELFKTGASETKQEEPVVEMTEKKPKVYGVNFPGVQFGRRTFILVEMEDPKLELENWMVDQRIWKIKK